MKFFLIFGVTYREAIDWCGKERRKRRGVNRPYWLPLVCAASGVCCVGRVEIQIEI